MALNPPSPFLKQVGVSCLEMKPFQRSIMYLCFHRPVLSAGLIQSCFSSGFIVEARGWGGRGGNLIPLSSNIPQSNITRLRSYHIQRGRAIFSHHSLLCLPVSSSRRSFIGRNKRTSVERLTPRGRRHQTRPAGGNSSFTPSVT